MYVPHRCGCARLDRVLPWWSADLLDRLFGRMPFERAAPVGEDDLLVGGRIDFDIEDGCVWQPLVGTEFVPRGARIGAAPQSCIGAGVHQVRIDWVDDDYVEGHVFRRADVHPGRLAR